jgi:predicted PolB exonuclease-like 3'-5' exonuclease
MFKRLWAAHGATSEEPEPFLPPCLSKIVSIAVVIRKVTNNQVTLRAGRSVCQRSDEEKAVITRFLSEAGARSPLLVGFGSFRADQPMLVQRALVHGISAPQFCARPNKPWDGRDYFNQYGEGVLDIYQELTMHSSMKGLSLARMSAMCGIPGKVGLDGSQVAQAFLEGRLESIGDYNLADAISTYLLFLRMCLLAGIIDSSSYLIEQKLMLSCVLEILERRHSPFLNEFVLEWYRLQVALETDLVGEFPEWVTIDTQEIITNQEA